MKNKNIILLSIIMLFTANAGFAADYYSEMLLDPFHSELNPEYIDEKNTASGEFELKKFIREKRLERQERKQQRKEEKLRLKQEKALKKAEEKAQKNAFVTGRDKPLTDAQLERELEEEQMELEKAEQKAREKEENLTLLEKIFNFRRSSRPVKKLGLERPEDDENINITADSMDYYPDTYEIHAIGNAKLNLKAQKTKIYADKIVFNYDKNTLTAFGDVELVSPDSKTEGSYLKLDLTQPNGWMQNPSTVTESIKIESKEAFICSGRLEEYDGRAKIIKDDVIRLAGRSFSSYIDQGGVLDEVETLSEESKGIYKIKANTIIIDSLDEHEVIKIKNAGVYLKDHKIAVIPTLKIAVNKTRSVVETNLPEIGSEQYMGMYAGPAVVLNVPGGSTLKLAPVLTYGSSGFGLGAIAKFRSENNYTQAGYGTSKEKFILKGRQRLAPGFLLNYSVYSNQSEWFLGYRMPKYSLNLEYSRSDYIKDLNVNFSQVYSAGIYTDNINGKYDFKRTGARFRWMTQTYKPIYKYYNKEAKAGIKFGIVAQTAASLYSQGNVTGIFRIGPSLNTQIGNWKQTISYYHTATAGESPFTFDRYRYGRGNIVFIESLKVNKYIDLGYIASVALHSKYHNDGEFNDSMLQESRFMICAGPEYAKLIVGYDVVRHTTLMQISMMLGTKDSDIEFKKTVIKNPEKFGQKSQKEKKPEKKSYKKYVKEAQQML